MDIQRTIRYALSLSLVLVFLLHVGGILSIPLLETLENHAYDARLKLITPHSAGRQVVIVDIDEKSLDAIGRWPWRRDVMASITDNLFDHYRVRAVGFDVLFAETDLDQGVLLLHQLADGPLKHDRAFQAEYARVADDLQRDRQFADSLDRRKTILGFVMDTRTRKGMLPEPVATLDHELNGRIPFVRPEGYSANLAILQSRAHGGGFFDNPMIDDDGVFRRVPLLQEYEGALYESFALALARTALGSPKVELVVESNPDNNNELFLEWLKLGELVIPVDQHAGILIPYRGPQKSFTYIPAIDVLDKGAAMNELEGKIVLFGASAPGLLDLRTTPLEAAFPGVEIHANIIQGILDRSVLQQPAYTTGLEFMLLLVLGVTLTFLLPMLSPLWGLLVSVSLLMLLVAGNLSIWSSYQLVLPIASPLLLVISLFILHMTYGFFVETRGKRQLAHLFGQYVPPELVNEMSTKMEQINLDGEIREMSVLFSDVRNFTSIAENMEPRELTQLINGFLTPITEVIHDSRGTIDKYMGDAVMAFWGAPLHDQRHARHALTAAMSMIGRIRQLGPEFQARGWPPISIGIGINTGEMNVGNKGSEFRVDYTVLGDAVNLASRLESLTRIYGVDIIVGENTRHAVPEFEYRELDRVKVKGKDRPVAIYEPLGLLENIDKSVRMELRRYHLGLKYFRARRWDDAEQILFALGREHPRTRIYQVYLNRIIHFRQQPPAEHWDGTYTHTTK